MKSLFLKTWSPAMLALAGLSSIPMTARADSQLSVDNLKEIEQWGLFTPGFQAAVHDLVDTKQAIVDAKKEELDLTAKVPELQKQAADAVAKVDALRKQLVEYDHGDESDFVQLQKIMGDSNARLADQVVVVQGYVWAYPFSPHLTEAQQDLQKLQKTQTDQVQAQKDASAARDAARAQLLQQVQAKSLSLNGWRSFLIGLTATDVVKYLGKPDVQGDIWNYPGNWTEDPTTHHRVGLQVWFDGGRVQSVVGLEIVPAPVSKVPEAQ